MTYQLKFYNRRQCWYCLGSNLLLLAVSNRTVTAHHVINVVTLQQ